MRVTSGAYSPKYKSAVHPLVSGTATLAGGANFELALTKAPPQREPLGLK